MSNIKKPILRIVRDIMELINDPVDGIEIKMNKENIYNQTAMIVGPKDTPYFGGFYFFDIKFPTNYPTKPPTVFMKTIDGNVRFNPNLYENGKVCLSILGTWSGPSWRSIMTLKTILISIQSLMNDFPITNEPGYENTDRNSSLNIDYNCYITYHNYRLAIIDTLSSKKNFRSEYKLFKKEIDKYINKNIASLFNNLQSYKLIYGKDSINKIVYFLKNKNDYDFIKLSKRFNRKFIKYLKKHKIIKNIENNNII
tara:strand:+ start:3678 stop:4439 length:762 start_codon:yes stop_codon:yes gene_type:complete